MSSRLSVKLDTTEVNEITQAECRGKYLRMKTHVCTYGDKHGHD